MFDTEKDLPDLKGVFRIVRNKLHDRTATGHWCCVNHVAIRTLERESWFWKGQRSYFVVGLITFYCLKSFKNKSVKQLEKDETQDQSEHPKRLKSISSWMMSRLLVHVKLVDKSKFEQFFDIFLLYWLVLLTFAVLSLSSIR